MDYADGTGHDNFKHGAITEKVIGVFFAVYNDLGFGFIESVYHKAMLIALADAGLMVDSQANLPVFFRGRIVGDFLADILVERAVILELNAASDFAVANEAQLINYLKASSVEVGLLLNFGPKPKFKRFVFDNDRERARPTIEFS